MHFFSSNLIFFFSAGWNMTCFMFQSKDKNIFNKVFAKLHLLNCSDKFDKAFCCQKLNLVFYFDCLTGAELDCCILRLQVNNLEQKYGSIHEKLDRVGPIDNRPSTNKLHQFIPKINAGSSLKRFGSESVLNIFPQWMSDLTNESAIIQLLLTIH